MDIESKYPVDNSNRTSKDEIKLYKRRWFILFLYVLYAAVSGIQWLEYSIIANIITRYYGVSSRYVDWTSSIIMIAYPITLLPGTYIINNTDLRITSLIGITGVTLSTWIKVFSADPDLFWVTFLGQVVMAVSQIFMMSVPPKLAAVWFGEHEVSTACGIGVFGQQLGAGLSFILPSMLVKNHDNLTEIGEDLSMLYYIFAGLTTPIAILMFVFFEAQPELPPSKTQKAERMHSKNCCSIKDMYSSYKFLLTNTPFLGFCVSCALNIGVYCFICTIFNQIILCYFPDSAEHAGIIGLLMIVFGMVGSVLFGYILDKTRKYKEITFIVYLLSFLALVAFLISLEMYDLNLIYITGCLIGFSINGFYTVAIEMVIELTFPESESMSSGILLSLNQILGFVMILISGWMLDTIGTFWVLVMFSSFLFVGSVLMLFIPKKLKRQEAYGGNSC